MAASLGFVGTGHITAAMVVGLCASPAPPTRVLVGPRNADTAAKLARRFKTVSVAADNQAVVDDSDWVVLAVRPQVAREVVGALKFRSGQKVLSLIAPIADEWIDDAVRPARLTARALPLPPCERHIGPIAFFPPDDAVQALFAPLGTPLAVADRRQFLTVWTLTALIATHYSVLAAAADWATANGVPARTAQTYAAAMFEALSAVAASPSAEAPKDLALHAQTPGGLNEQVVRALAAKGLFDAIGPALDGILKRLEGAR